MNDVIDDCYLTVCLFVWYKTQGISKDEFLRHVGDLSWKITQKLGYWNQMKIISQDNRKMGAPNDAWCLTVWLWGVGGLIRFEWLGFWDCGAKKFEMVGPHCKRGMILVLSRHRALRLKVVEKEKNQDELGIEGCKFLLGYCLKVFF